MLPPPRASAPPPPSVPRATDGAAIGGALAESSAQIVRAECARCQQRQLCSCRRVVALARAAGGGDAAAQQAEPRRCDGSDLGEDEGEVWGVKVRLKVQVRARVEEKVRAWAEVGVRMRGEGEAEVEGEGEGTVSSCIVHSGVLFLRSCSVSEK